MKSKIFNVSFCIFVLLASASYPLFAQEGGSVGSSGSMPSAPTTGITSPQGSLPSTPSQSGQSFSQPSTTPQQGITATQGSGIQQPTTNLQNLTQQPESQSPTTETQIAPQIAEAVSQPEPLSSIETAFQDVSLMHTPAEAGVPVTALRQFGYSLFKGRISTFAPVEDVPVGPDYVLGPGDELHITIWGTIENTYVQIVDRYGRIYLPTIGPVRVWGLTFSQAEKLILAHLSQYYKGFQSSVTMGHLRTIRVYIVGEVNQPGSYNISALSTITNALFAAGGPSKTGSLRKIELKRNHRTVESFDFYDFLLYGDKSKDSRLESGDVIFVPPIGIVVGIMGQIKRPAIYELKEPIHINNFINNIAGGLTPQSYLKHVQVTRTKPNAEREVIDLDLTEASGKENNLKDIELQNGDLVKIYPSDPRIYNTVSLDGKVKYPGNYEFKTGMTLSQILTPESLLPEAYLDNIEIIRFKEDLTTEVIRANLKKIWKKEAQDVNLQPLDQIFVRSEFKEPETMSLAGELKRPGTYTIQPGERISSVLKRAGGFTDLAYLKGAIFARKAVREKEKEKLEEFVKQYEESLITEEQSILTLSEESKRLQQLELAKKREQLKIVASKITLGRIVVHLDDPQKLEGTPDDLILEDGDVLTIPRMPAQVMVIGSVRNPTSFIHIKGENIQYYLNRGGGFTKTADEKEIYVIKADGSAVVGFLKLRDIDAGDAIIVPPKVEIRDWTWIRDIATITGQTALTFAALATIL